MASWLRLSSPTRAGLGLSGMIGSTLLFSCANPGAPTGGPRDLTGPQVVETIPDTFAVVTTLDQIEIRFDERISERGFQGTLDGAVIVSPESGEVSVRHSSRPVTTPQKGLAWRSP